MMLTICREIGLEMSAKQVERIKRDMSLQNFNYGAFSKLVDELSNRIEDEISVNKYMVIPKNKVDFYSQRELFGSDVSTKFSDINDDVERAGKCFATGNHTATVFHLMRVMERGVQYLGAKLGVKLAHEKDWQTILNEVNTAIKALSSPSTKMTPQMKQERDNYAAASERLQNVKDAWRNKVMHPKDSYDETEAEEIFTATKRFMQHLDKIT